MDLMTFFSKEHMCFKLKNVSPFKKFRGAVKMFKIMCVFDKEKQGDFYRQNY